MKNCLVKKCLGLTESEIITPHSSRKRAPDEEKEEEDSRAKVSPQSLFIASPPPLK
jgi:hypothetical protein